MSCRFRMVNCKYAGGIDIVCTYCMDPLLQTIRELPLDFVYCGYESSGLFMPWDEVLWK